jgi:hypothetical protein
MKKLSTILLLSFGLLAQAQKPVPNQPLGAPIVNLEVKGGLFVDSAFWPAFRDTLWTPQVEGTIVYWPAQHIYYGFRNGYWWPFSAPVTASNGLSASGTNVQLGGNPLIQNTTIHGAGYSFTMDSTSLFRFGSLNSSSGNIGTLQMSSSSFGGGYIIENSQANLALLFSGSLSGGNAVGYWTVQTASSGITQPKIQLQTVDSSVSIQAKQIRIVNDTTQPNGGVYIVTTFTGGAGAGLHYDGSGTRSMVLIDKTTGQLYYGPPGSLSGTGTLDSAGLTMPATFTVTNSPLTGTGGTIHVTYATENPNTFFAGPGSGIAAIPTFRILTTGDLPVGIPNANLANSNFNLSVGSTGTSPNWSTSTVNLGGTEILNLPLASAVNTGILLNSDWVTFNAKVTTINGQTGNAIVGNADSIKKLPVDTTTHRNGYVLTFDSTNHKWYLSPGGGSSSGISSIGTLDGNGAFANGASISGSSLFLQSASATNPGLVNNTVQSFSGNKTFIGSLTLTGITNKIVGVTDSALIRDASGKVWVTPIGILTANNGLTQTGSVVQLGGTLVQSTTIDGLTSYELTVQGSTSTANGLLFVNNTLASGANTAIKGQSIQGIGVKGASTSGTGVYGSSSSADAVFGTSISSNGGEFSSSSGNAILAESITGVGGIFLVTPSSTNTVVPVIELLSGSSGTAANGIGGKVQFLTQTTTGAFQVSNELVSTWTNATSASRTSQFIITGVNNTTTANLLTLSGSGALQLNKYGAGTFTGTPAFNLQTDGSGNIIESAVTTASPPILYNNSTGVISMASSGVGAGSCTNCNLTYDIYGRLLVANSGSGGSGNPNIQFQSVGANLNASGATTIFNVIDGLQGVASGGNKVTYSLTNDSLITSGNWYYGFSNGRYGWLNSNDTIFGVNGIQVLGVRRDSIGLGGTLYQTTHISGSSLYNLSLDSLGLLLTGPAFASPNNVDTVNNKVLVRNISTGLVKEMYWPATGGGSSLFTRTHTTSGTSGTVGGGNYIITFDFAAPISAYALTTPASPTDQQKVIIEAGGTLTSGSEIATLTIIANSGQAIMGPTSFQLFVGGAYDIQWNSTTSAWYVHNLR